MHVVKSSAYEICGPIASPEIADPVNPPAVGLMLLARHDKEGIRMGVLDQFDLISLKPRLVALVPFGVASLAPNPA